MDVKGILIDLDGVLYTGDSAIPGAADALRYLKSKGYQIRYLSNTTRKNRKTIQKRLLQFGFDIEAGEIFTPAAAAVAFLSETTLQCCHLLITGDVSDEFGEAGIHHVDAGADWVVIGDAGDNFSYAAMTKAFRLIKEGAGIIALEKDRYWMGSDGLMLSAGPFVEGLEYATGKTAAVMGKPSAGYFRMALTSMGVGPEDAVMIGDDVVSDTGGAMNAGLKGILVKTGKYDEDSVRSAVVKPDVVIGSIASIGDIL